MNHVMLAICEGYASDLGETAGLRGHGKAMKDLIKEVIRLQIQVEELESKLSLAESDATVAAQEGDNCE